MVVCVSKSFVVCASLSILCNQYHAKMCTLGKINLIQSLMSKVLLKFGKLNVGTVFSSNNINNTVMQLQWVSDYYYNILSLVIQI